MTPVAAQADSGFTVPEGFLPKAFVQTGVQIQSMAEAKRGLESAPQILDTRKCDVAALNRAQLRRALEVAVNAQIKQTADLDRGRLAPGRTQRKHAQRCGQTSRKTYQNRS